MAAGGTIITRNDRLRLILAQVAKLRGAKVTIGIHASAGQHAGSPETVADIALKHEFGSGRIPERSFLRSTVDGNPKPMIQAQKAANKVCHGQLTAQQACDQIGLVTVGEVKQTIFNKIPPPLSQQTIAVHQAKAAHGGGLAGHADATTPLIDSGQMISSITHEVQI